MSENMDSQVRLSSIEDLLEHSSYGDYLQEIMKFYVPLALKLPSLRDNPDFMEEEIKGVGRSGITDVATKADKFMQDQIKQNLHSFHPEWGFWGEEGEDRITQLDKNKSFTLVTDPIEGTNNFKRRIDDQWGSVIALIDNKSGEPVIGIVAHPTEKRFYIGVKGSGSYVIEYDENGEMSDFKPMSQETERTTFTYNNSPHFSEELFEQVDRFLKQGKIIKTNELGRSTIGIPDENSNIFEDLESGALEAVRNRGTIYFKTSAEMAAVFVILNELGGKVTDALGKPWSININTLIAARNKDDYQFLTSIFNKTN